MVSISCFCVNFVFLFSVTPLIVSLYIRKRCNERRIAPFLVMKRVPVRVPVQDLTRASAVRGDDDPFMSC